MFKIVVLILVAVIAAFLAYVATKPAEFRITRARTIKAPAEILFTLINDLHQFNRWNPFAAADPAVKIVYSGPPKGAYAAYDWEGNSKTGQGRMQIAESVAPSRVVMHLDFIKPFKAHNRVEFTVTSAGQATTVHWVMTGRNGYLQKLLGTLFNMDKMVGGEFDKGFTNLQALAER